MVQYRMEKKVFYYFFKHMQADNEGHTTIITFYSSNYKELQYKKNLKIDPGVQINFLK